MDKILMWIDADKQIDDVPIGEVKIDIKDNCVLKQISVEPNVWTLDNINAIFLDKSITLTLPKEVA